MKVYGASAKEDENVFSTMTSMRSVDGMVRGTVRIWED